MEFKIDRKKVFCATGGQPFNAKKRTVILIHGAGMDHSYWSLQSRWFAWHDWSVLAPDLPGHRDSGGRSLPSIEKMSAWIGHLMEEAGLKEAALVGHSMGAIVALQAAADMPNRVNRIALLGVADAIPVHPDLLEAAKINDPLAYDLVTSWGHGRNAHFGGNQQPGIWMLGSGRQLLARNRPGVLYSDLHACNEWKNGLNAARKTRCRALVIIGDGDQMTPPKRTQLIVDALPECKRVVLEKCGHMMMQEQPDQTLDALIAEFQN
ncbi:MAG: alpha/beta hydrolase [SAR324 cluster bacterium]|nr:alpha/beta hydrolase [SAR324 cluster bacterium]